MRFCVWFVVAFAFGVLVFCGLCLSSRSFIVVLRSPPIMCVGVSCCKYQVRRSSKYFLSGLLGAYMFVILICDCSGSLFRVGSILILRPMSSVSIFVTEYGILLFDRIMTHAVLPVPGEPKTSPTTFSSV